jgi:membrane protease YdiL (CAAX protease family)
VGSAAAIILARQKQLSLPVAAPIALAFLVELSLLAGIRCMVRLRLLAWVVSAVVPYLILTVSMGTFQLWRAGLIALLASVLCFSLPSLNAKWDCFFLAFLAVLLLSPGLYPEVLNLKVPTLGRLTWFRLGMTCVLTFRNHDRLNFGFWPTGREWWVGARTVCLIVPAAIALNTVLPVVHFRVVPGLWWKAPGYFFGILWIVGLAEEVFTRGMLLEWIRERLGIAAAVVLSSLVFGLAHLWFRGFPNLTFAALAAVVGAFYASAYLTGGGVRASTVSHALTVTLWKVLFSG